MKFDCNGQLQIDLSHMRYSSYGGATARGTATVYIYEPCASCERPVTQTGAFVLTDIRQCSDGRLYYTEASETVRHPPGSLSHTLTYAVAPTATGMC